MIEGLDARSAAPHMAVPLPGEAELSDVYERAWNEWSAADDASLWEWTSGDGLVNERDGEID